MNISVGLELMNSMRTNSLMIGCSVSDYQISFLAVELFRECFGLVIQEVNKIPRDSFDSYQSGMLQQAEAGATGPAMNIVENPHSERESSETGTNQGTNRQENIPTQGTQGVHVTKKPTPALGKAY